MKRNCIRGESAVAQQAANCGVAFGKHTGLLPVIVFIVFLSQIITGCTGKKEWHHGKQPLEIAVSVAPRAYFVKAIGGDSVEVSILLPSGSDPETFEPGMGTLRTLHSHGVLFTTALMPFERKIAENILANNSEVRVVNVATGLNLIYGTHAHEHHHDEAEECNDQHAHADEADPHVWNSVENARIISKNILSALCDAASANTPYYIGRFDNLMHRLDSLQQIWSEKLAPRRGTVFAIEHPSLSYFARDFGLKQIAYGAEHKEASVRGTADAIEKIRSANARVLFVGRGNDPAKAAMLGKSVGLRPVEIMPMSEQWEKEMQNIVENL